MTTCENCGTLALLSVVWGKYEDSEGKPKFWRAIMCATCKKESGGK